MRYDDDVIGGIFCIFCIFVVFLHYLSVNGRRLMRLVVWLCFCITAAYAYVGRSHQRRLGFSLRANPVHAEGSRLRVSEDEAVHWFDRAFMKVKGGQGGLGANTVKFGAGRTHAYPNGGSGGNGGSVFVVGDERLNTLLKFQGSVSYKAAAGEDGDAHYVNGRQGADVYINVPVGTTIWNNGTGELMSNITEDKQTILVAKGGLGGRGNAAVKNARRALQKVSPPLPPDSATLKLEMKLIADIGLVGVPNCGKSTLLSRITNATPKIASYAFTTKVPNIGICDVGRLKPGADPILVADVPGLLEGAHDGRGLGRAFLRHVESCRVLIHLVDGLSKDPIGDLTAINRELELFSPMLAAKPQVVVLNKVDAASVDANCETLLARLRDSVEHSRVMAISALTSKNVDQLVLRVAKLLTAVKKQHLEEKHVDMQQVNESSAVNVEVQEEGHWVVVTGPGVDRLLRLVDCDHYDAMSRFASAAELFGIFDQIAESTPSPVTGARVQFQGRDESMEFRWSAESKDLLPQLRA